MGERQGKGMGKEERRRDWLVIPPNISSFLKIFGSKFPVSLSLKKNPKI